MAYNIHACAVASIVIFATSVVLTLLRFYTRRFISKRFWLDDWFALLGLVRVNRRFQPFDISLNAPADLQK